MGIMIDKIIKRNGAAVRFDGEKIKIAIMKAMQAVGALDQELAANISKKVEAELVAEFTKEGVPSVEDVQDKVESSLVKAGLLEAAKAYILYRKEHADIRAAKMLYDVADDMKLSVNAVKVLSERYLLKDLEGRIIETPSKMFRRVAEHVGAAEDRYPNSPGSDETSAIFYEAMSSLEFLPNSPTLMNAGTQIDQLAACFVLPIEDSLESIFEAVKRMALVHQSGGGTGFSFSKLRPKGDRVKTTKGVASGPVSFMRVFDVATDVVKQGGRRRGANMAILDVTHPDILEFINAKKKPGEFENFNLSVAVTDDFLDKARDGLDIDLINPGSNETWATMSAAGILDMIIASSWECGDPGLIFIDRINDDNPTPFIGRIEATNPCSEQPLLPNESCVLGSINLSKLVKDNDIDWARLAHLAAMGVRFLDDVIDVGGYVFEEIECMTKANRKIGLGVMGFADMLIELGLPYDSSEALNMASRIMEFISKEARKASVDLGREKGSFANFADSVWPGRGFEHMRNATVTTIAPTGTLSMIADCSSSIEPLFAIAYIRHILEGSELIEVNRAFKKLAKERGIYSDDLLREIIRYKSLRRAPSVPQDIKRLMPIASDIAPGHHVRMQAAFQRHTDNATSKTVNLPFNATLEDVREVFMTAADNGCKGVTVYRYGSKSGQALTYPDDISCFKDKDEIIGDNACF